MRDANIFEHAKKKKNFFRALLPRQAQKFHPRSIVDIENPIEMASDSDLVNRLREILRNSDLDTATAGSIRRQLEEDFGVDLSDRKAFIRDQIDIFLEILSQVNNEENAEQNEEENENDAVNEEEEEEEEEEESDEKQNRTGSSNKAEKGVKKRGGFTKLCSLSPQLQEFVGVPELARTEVVKKLWSYIRENSLQDPKNKRNIKCDDALRALFRVNSINMFQMNKVLSKHIWPLTAEDENVKLKAKRGDSNNSASDGDTAGEEEDEREEDKKEEEEEENVKKVRNGRSKKGGSTKVDKDVKKRGGGFTKLCSLSPQLQEFIGVPELARTEVVKKLWTHIRENNLQDPKNKRNIICDTSLRALFHVESIDMFQMNKALSKHIWPLNEEDAPDNSSEKEREDKCGIEEGPDGPKQKAKRQKKGSSGFLAPKPLSDALVKFFGTGENTLSRADVVKRMWEYIKRNDLQDPSDKRRIICDDKLKELFDVDSFIGFSISKLLTAHFVKTEQ